MNLSNMSYLILHFFIYFFEIMKLSIIIKLYDEYIRQTVTILYFYKAFTK